MRWLALGCRSPAGYLRCNARLQGEGFYLARLLYWDVVNGPCCCIYTDILCCYLHCLWGIITIFLRCMYILESYICLVNYSPARSSTESDNRMGGFISATEADQRTTMTSQWSTVVAPMIIRLRLNSTRKRLDDRR